MMTMIINGECVRSACCGLGADWWMLTGDTWQERSWPVEERFEILSPWRRHCHGSRRPKTPRQTEFSVGFVWVPLGTYELIWRSSTTKVASYPFISYRMRGTKGKHRDLSGRLAKPFALKKFAMACRAGTCWEQRKRQRKDETEGEEKHCLMETPLSEESYPEIRTKMPIWCLGPKEGSIKGMKEVA